jgi:hypothetical protein
MLIALGSIHRTATTTTKIDLSIPAGISYDKSH